MSYCKECNQDKEFMYNDGEHGDQICNDCHLEMFSECYHCSKFHLDKDVESRYIDEESENRLVCKNCIKERGL